MSSRLRIRHLIAVALIAAPMLILPGNDLEHPQVIADELAALAPNVEVVMPWKDPADATPRAVAKLRAFLQTHGA